MADTLRAAPSPPVTTGGNATAQPRQALPHSRKRETAPALVGKRRALFRPPTTPPGLGSVRDPGGVVCPGTGGRGRDAGSVTEESYLPSASRARLLKET